MSLKGIRSRLRQTQGSVCDSDQGSPSRSSSFFQQLATFLGPEESSSLTKRSYPQEVFPILPISGLFIIICLSAAKSFYSFYDEIPKCGFSLFSFITFISLIDDALNTNRSTFMYVSIYFSAHALPNVSTTRGVHTAKQDDAANSGGTNFEDHLLSLVMAKGK